MVNVHDRNREAGDRVPVVLFVDDEPAILNGIRLTLRKEPYEVVTVGSAKDALTILAERDVAVLVSDARMPVMSGTEFLDRVIATYPSVVRIMLTGEADLTVTRRLIEDGRLYRFLSKPVSAEELKGVLRIALQSRQTTREARLVREQLQGPTVGGKVGS